MKIIHLNHQRLLDPRLQPLLASYGHDWNAVQRLSMINPGCPNYTVRIGKNIMPFDNSIVGQLKLTAPQFDITFNQDLSHLMDSRFCQLTQTLNDKPWLLYWSGGIDSTAVVASVLKNSSSSQRKNILIACNKISLYENPSFFYEYIKPNFSLADSTMLQVDQNVLTTYYVITGEFSDQLFSGSLSLQMQQKDFAGLGQDLFKHPDPLINYLAKKFKNLHQAEWFYQHMVENIRSTTVPVTTYNDFFWWWFYNLMWVTVKIRPALNFCYSAELMKLYLNNYIGWFESDDFQQWSMNNNLVHGRYGQNLSEYKIDLKKYIYDLDHNDYYLKFKTKLNSNARYNPSFADWFCVLDDLSCLNLNDNLDLITKLLPDYIN